MYEVICKFTDLQDFNHPYDVGDIFPRQGMSVSQARIDELSSKNNKRGIPLIKKIEKNIEIADKPITAMEDKATENKENKTKAYKKSDIMNMRKDDLVELATENGINALEMSGSEIKKRLIELLGL